LERLGVRILRNDNLGDIIINTDNISIQEQADATKNFIKGMIHTNA